MVSGPVVTPLMSVRSDAGPYRRLRFAVIGGNKSDEESEVHGRFIKPHSPTLFLKQALGEFQFLDVELPADRFSLHLC